jgi:hypothetical protein
MLNKGTNMEKNDKETENLNPNEKLANELKKWQKEYYDLVDEPFRRQNKPEGEVAFHSWQDRFTKFLRQNSPTLATEYESAASRFIENIFSSTNTPPVHTVWKMNKGEVIEAFLKLAIENASAGRIEIVKNSMIKNIVVCLTKEQTYRHLFTLCQNDELFTIIDFPDGWEEKDYERIVISDAEAMRNGTERSAIGTVRLLPYHNGTTIMFVNKDALWHKEMTEADRNLFAKYIERAITHFSELDLILHKSENIKENSNQIVIKGNVSGSNIILGNENKADNSSD